MAAGQSSVQPSLGRMSVRFIHVLRIDRLGKRLVLHPWEDKCRRDFYGTSPVRHPHPMCQKIERGMLGHQHPIHRSVPMFDLPVVAGTRIDGRLRRGMERS